MRFAADGGGWRLHGWPDSSRCSVTRSLLQLPVQTYETERDRIVPRIGRDHHRILLANDVRDAGVFRLERDAERIAALAAFAVAGQGEQLLVALDAVEHGRVQHLVDER